jgi:glutamine amidotransferase
MPVSRPLSAVRPRVVVLDYGSGNLRSAERALAAAGADVIVTDDLALAENADGLVVPGVGAYAACMAGIEEAKAAPVIAARVEQGLPVLGICVGAQIMFEAGDEHGVVTEGLGLLPGRVTRLPVRRVPHIGWNTVSPPAGSVLFAGFAPDTRCYFVHSFAAFPSDVDLTWPGPSGAIAGQDVRAGKPLVTTTEHEGVVFVAAVEAGPLSVTQFHPEKSGSQPSARRRKPLHSQRPSSTPPDLRQRPRPCPLARPGAWPPPPKTAGASEQGKSATAGGPRSGASEATR